MCDSNQRAHSFTSSTSTLYVLSPMIMQFALNNPLKLLTRQLDRSAMHSCWTVHSCLSPLQCVVCSNAANVNRYIKRIAPLGNRTSSADDNKLPISRTGKVVEAVKLVCLYHHTVTSHSHVLFCLANRSVCVTARIVAYSYVCMLHIIYICMYVCMQCT
jgi:hypothetical protein